MKALFLQLRAAFRFIMFVTVILTYLVHGTIIYFLNSKRDVRRRKLSENAHNYCKRLVAIFGVTVICKNPIRFDEHSLLIGNHVGFIDILALLSLQPSVFVTSREMRNAPGLGQLCEVAGCAYVDRVNRMKIHDELKDLIHVLKKGFRIVLYAEATASNGEQVLPFKKTLLMAAGLAGVPIRPFVFNFRSVNGEPVQFKHRDAVCWYGNQTFLPAIWRSLQLETITCEIEFLPLLYPKPEDDRAVIANTLFQMVSEKFVPFVDDTKNSKSV